VPDGTDEFSVAMRRCQIGYVHTAIVAIDVRQGGKEHVLPPHDFFEKISHRFYEFLGYLFIHDIPSCFCKQTPGSS
jgi:hypothetical protein